MSYVMQKLNVVKTVERVEQRDALLAKGYVEVKDKKTVAKSVSKQKDEGDKGDAE